MRFELEAEHGRSGCQLPFALMSTPPLVGWSMSLARNTQDLDLDYLQTNQSQAFGQFTSVLVSVSSLVARGTTLASLRDSHRRALAITGRRCCGVECGRWRVERRRRGERCVVGPNLCGSIHPWGRRHCIVVGGAAQDGPCPQGKTSLPLRRTASDGAYDESIFAQGWATSCLVLEPSWLRRWWWCLLM